MAAFPPPPVSTIDWSRMQDFTVPEVNGHITSTYTHTTGQWTPLKFVTSPYIQLHGMSPALNYGQQILEGFKAFRGPSNDTINLFRPINNAKRFQHSAAILSMPSVPEELFLRACKAAVALNAEYVPPHDSGGSLYIRPQLYGSGPQLGLTATGEYTFNMFVVPTGIYQRTQAVKALILDGFDRAAPQGTGHAKVGGNYAPVLRWSDGAKKGGYGITLHLDSKRHEEVDEFSTCAFIGVKTGEGGEDDVTIVVSDSPCVIESVTCDSVQQIGRSFGWKVEKRSIPYTELPEFSEVLGSGTSVALVPIRSITRNGKRLNDAEPRVQSDEESETIRYLSDEHGSGGAVYQRLLAKLWGVQLGKVRDEFGWQVEVREKDREVDGA